MESFSGMACFLSPLDINVADDKEIPETDQLWTNHCRAQTWPYTEELIIFLFILIASVDGKIEELRKGCLCWKTALQTTLVRVY